MNIADFLKCGNCHREKCTLYLDSDGEIIIKCNVCKEQVNQLPDETKMLVFEQ